MTKPRFRRHADGATSLIMGDSFVNMVSGLGMADLKASANSYVMPITSHELETAYRTSTWFGKIIDIPAEDETREWRSWKAKTKQITALDKAEAALNVQQKVLQARQWQRLYGGAAIVIGGLPGLNEQPLSLDRVRRDSIKFLTVLTKDELVAEGGIVRNPLDADYGKPAFFRFANTSEKIHPSRVVVFNGRKVSPLSSSQDFWGDPEWFHLEAAVKSADASGAVIDALLQEAKVDVLRVDGMTRGLASADYEALMIRRFQMVAILKGMQNVMLLDKNDEWEQKQINWSGIPDVAKHVLNILSGASNIPMFRLTGQNLTGLSSSGDAEQRAYYDGVRSNQKLRLTPNLNLLDEVMIRTALGSRPEDVWYDWNSLYQMSDKEKAEIDKMEAETANIYVTTGLIPTPALEKAVQNRMIESGRWPGLEQALEELPEDFEEEDDEETVALLQAALARGQGAAEATAGGDNPPQPEEKPAPNLADALARPLYIRRDVRNAAEIVKWAKDNGFESTVPPESMHVTILYSKTPVDWLKMPTTWEEEIIIPAGGARVMDRFGEDGSARVLRFNSPSLKWRHQDLIDSGASSSHDEYSPHITISWNSGLEGPEEEWPTGYSGPIVLGPEIFETIDEDWKASLTEDQEK